MFWVFFHTVVEVQFGLRSYSVMEGLLLPYLSFCIEATGDISPYINPTITVTTKNGSAVGKC